MPYKKAWFAAVAAIGFGVVTNAANAQSITEYPIPTINSGPQGIVAGPDGGLWFTEYLGNKIGRITTAGQIIEFSIPTPNSGPRAITPGPDGNLWFTEFNGNNIAKITPTGTITEYPIPTPNSAPFGIVTGQDGNVWFTESASPFTPISTHRVGKITVNGVMTEFVFVGSLGPIGNCDWTDITTAPDGHLWFGTTCSAFYSMTTAGTFDAAFGLNGIFDPVYAIAFGPNGQMWATIYSATLPASRLAMFPVNGPEQLYTMSATTWPYGITSGRDGNMWFTEANANQIASVTPAGAITEYAIPTPNSMPRGITVGPDAAIWFAEFGSNKIGRFTRNVAVVPTEVPTLQQWGLWVLALATVILAAMNRTMIRA